MSTAVTERCALCGGYLPDVRVIVGGQKFHVRCSHDGRDHRIAELEAALRVVLAELEGDRMALLAQRQLAAYVKKELAAHMCEEAVHDDGRSAECA